MASTARCCFVLVILGAAVQVRGVWNFRAVGEYLTVDVDDCTAPYSVESTRYFEEVHYAEGESINKTALRIDASDIDKSAFFGDFEQGKAFWQLGDEDCAEVGQNDPTMPHFKPWRFDSEANYAPVYLALTQLRYRVKKNDADDESGSPVVERGLDAVKVELDLTDNKTDPAYFVEKAFLTFEKNANDDYDYKNLIPLSMEMCVVINGTRSLERLSIVEFSWNTTVEEDASPPGGATCDGYGGSDPLPNVFDWSTVVLRTEQAIDKNLTSGDIAIDFGRKLLHIDNGVDDYFLSTSQNLIYKVANPDSRAQGCEISTATAATKLDWTFVEFKAKSAKEFFGVNENFKRRTKTKRRGIVCDLFVGIRDDYLPELGAPSVWEWCIGELETVEGDKKYLVHLDVSIRLPGGAPYQESYTLYDVRSVDPKKLYLDYFTELESCFDDSRKMNLQVIVDGPEASSADDTGTAVESESFRAALLDLLLTQSGLEPDSYRFGSTEAYLVDRKSAVFQFYLLDSPEDASSDQRVDKIFKKLQNVTSESDLTVDVNGVQFSLRKGSLDEAQDMDRHTTESTTVGEPTGPTTPDSGGPTTEENGLPEISEGYHGALVWGVAFAVLLVGGGVGYFAGDKYLINFF